MDAKMTGQKDGIEVCNAGIVVLQGYFKLLFERLELTDGADFKDRESQLKAVCCLQYLATGLSVYKDSDLALLKLLCGLPLDVVVGDGIVLSEKEKALLDSLIVAAMNHWPESGGTSVAGFRGNWLVRNGVLTEQLDHWTFVVDRKAYDVLLARSPFAFSIVKLPFMAKAVYVTWWV